VEGSAASVGFLKWFGFCVSQLGESHCLKTANLSIELVAHIALPTNRDLMAASNAQIIFEGTDDLPHGEMPVALVEDNLSEFVGGVVFSVEHYGVNNHHVRTQITGISGDA